MMLRWTLIIIGFLIIIGLSGIAYSQNYRNIRNIQSYDDCLKAGYPDLLTYPGQCITPNGQRFRQPLTQQEDRLKSLINK